MAVFFLAILACVGHGLFCALINVFTSEIGESKVSPFSFFALSNFLGALLAWCIVPFCDAAVPERLGVLTLVLGAGGFTFVIALFVQVRCYAQGKRGLTSACGTLSNIVPFVFGVLVIGERPTWQKCVGMVLLIIGMAVCALSGRKNGQRKSDEDGSELQASSDSSNYRLWLGLVLLFILLNGCGQIFQVLSSWLGFDGESRVLRAAMLMTLSSFGNVLACLVTRTPFWRDFRVIFKWAALWAFIGTGTNLMQFVAADAMARQDMGAITMVISSSTGLLFFLLYSAIRFRERYKAMTFAGIGSCLLGLLAIALGSSNK